MREIDWADTPLGPVESWPQALRSALGICLGSRFPIAIYWGRELALLYNDAWSPIAGSKHPWSLGRGARDVWPEIWDSIGPLFDQVMRTGEATYAEDSLLAMHRHGYTEECYFNFTFTPIRGERGEVEGIFNAVIETTFRVISARRSRVLRELGERLAGARSAGEVYERAVRSLGAAAHDVPFCAVYAGSSVGANVALAACAGVEPGGALPAAIAAGEEGPWPIEEVTRNGRVQLVTGLGERLDVPLPGGAWPEAADAALLAPIVTGAEVSAVLVAGVSPRRAVDDEYRQFVERAAAQIGAVVSSATAYEEERKRCEALAALDRAKTVFFNNVSHEFRTPLTLMLGPTENALASAEQALRGPALEIVYRNELRLLKLVNTLLDFSRIEAGRMEPRFERTDVAALTLDLANGFRSTVERGGLTFEVDCPSLAGEAYVDRMMWEKIVLNLISNAFKFTFEGSIRVTLRELEGHLQLEVSDTGVGIPQDHLPRVFERFHRIEGTRARTHEGSGIGLALIHDLVDLHRGSVEVESELGRGTTFRIRMPLGRGHLPAERVGSGEALSRPLARLQSYVAEASRWLPEPPLGADPSAEPDLPAGVTIDAAHVLVVDDNADMRDYVTRILEAHWTVETAPDGAAALEAVRRRRPDLVLTDVMMPNLDGFGLLRALRSAPDTAGIPVLMVSARAGEESRVDGLRAGATDYLVKPFAARELVARVATHLHLAKLRHEAENANRAKDEFLAMLGHELRNPLAPIRTATQLVRLKGAAGIDREIGVIERQVEHLSGLVDDLLDVSRIARGRVELTCQPLEIATVVAKAIEISSPLLEQRNHELVVRVPRQGLVVDADPGRLAQVVSNLLTNAAKYTEPRGRVTITAARQGGDVLLDVADTGIGVRPEMLGTIFEMFAQEHQSLDRSQGGLGLGLTIVKNLVLLHGGTVSAHSAGLGRGSTFRIRLPAVEVTAVAEDGADRPADPDPVEAASGRCRILVVDDNQDAASTMAAYLEALGCTTRVAHDGLAAAEVARQFEPQLALVDIGLPVMDGYELARRLRAEPALRALRLVAVTGYGQPGDRQRSRDAGFDEHLVKPVDLERLRNLIGELVA